MNTFPFDRSSKLRSFFRLLSTIYRDQPDFVVMEGTGIAGGAALIAARIVLGQRFVVSSGDAVGPWVGIRHRFLGPFFGFYERLLCRFAAGYIGWTPYLAGRALTFGVSRAMTAAGWAPFVRSLEMQAIDRVRTREKLCIPHGNVVVGIAGSMVWSHRHGYCYGWELVQAAHKIKRDDVTFLIIGDGTGLPRLQACADSLPAGKVVFTGRVSQEDLPGYYAAMDIGSLPQSVDQVGSFRYTTKLSEYMAFRLPVITSQTPFAYDFDGRWLWRLPGDAPWTNDYITALAETVDGLGIDEVHERRSAVPTNHVVFDRALQVARASSFIRDLAK